MRQCISIFTQEFLHWIQLKMKNILVKRSFLVIFSGRGQLINGVTPELKIIGAGDKDPAIERLFRDAIKRARNFDSRGYW